MLIEIRNIMWESIICINDKYYWREAKEYVLKNGSKDDIRCFEWLQALLDLN